MSVLPPILRSILTVFLQNIPKQRLALTLKEDDSLLFRALNVSTSLLIYKENSMQCKCY